MRQIGTNERTRYEIIAEDRQTGRKVLVGYTARKSQDGITAMLTQTLDDVAMARLHRLSKATAKEPASWEAFGRKPEVKSGTWTVKFSGRTQRDCRSTGELVDSIYSDQYDV